MLETDVYTFNDRWFVFSGKISEICTVTLDAGIYLNHTNGIHYDVVLSVHKLPVERNIGEEELVDLGESTNNDNIETVDANQEMSCNKTELCHDYCKQEDKNGMDKQKKKNRQRTSAAMKRKMDRER